MKREDREQGPLVRNNQSLLSTEAKKSPLIDLKHICFIKKVACRGLIRPVLFGAVLVSERRPTGARVVLKSPLLSMRHASTHSPKHPRELCFPAGEGELTSIPIAVSPAAVTATALGERVLSQHNGDSLGHQHKPPAEMGSAREFMSYSSAGEFLPICRMRITKPYKRKTATDGKCCW